jgi:hypothetical protein
MRVIAKARRLSDGACATTPAAGSGTPAQRQGAERGPTGDAAAARGRRHTPESAPSVRPHTGRHCSEYFSAIGNSNDASAASIWFAVPINYCGAPHWVVGSVTVQCVCHGATNAVRSPINGSRFRSGCRLRGGGSRTKRNKTESIGLLSCCRVKICGYQGGEKRQKIVIPERGPRPRVRNP